MGKSLRFFDCIFVLIAVWMEFCRLTVRLAKGLDLLNSGLDPFASRVCHSLQKTSKSRQRDCLTRKQQRRIGDLGWRRRSLIVSLSRIGIIEDSIKSQNQTCQRTEVSRNAQRKTGLQDSQYHKKRRRNPASMSTKLIAISSHEFIAFYRKANTSRSAPAAVQVPWDPLVRTIPS
jgi:hypothetical protein